MNKLIQLAASTIFATGLGLQASAAQADRLSVTYATGHLGHVAPHEIHHFKRGYKGHYPRHQYSYRDYGKYRGHGHSYGKRHHGKRGHNHSCNRRPGKQHAYHARTHRGDRHYAVINRAHRR